MKDLNLFKKIIERELELMRRGPRSSRYKADDVHVLRVAALRTGFALKFFGRLRETGGMEKTMTRLKEARRVMGEARNFDILLTRVKRYLEDLNESPSRRKEIVGSIQSRRAASHRAYEAMLKSPRYAAILQEMESIKDRHVPQDLPGIIKGPFKKTLAGLLKYRRKQIHPRDLHKIRIAFKKLRYACSFLEDIEPALQETQKFIENFQDLLGERQDAIASVDLLSGFDRKQMSGIIGREKALIKDYRRRFENLWKKSFLKSSKIEGLYGWSRHYPLIFMSF
jgi:CHAD domain-containing protein